MISDESEKGLVGSLNNKLLLLFYGGPVLAVGCLAGIVLWGLPKFLGG